MGFRYRERGYISQAMPTPIPRNSKKDHNAYLSRVAGVCLPAHANAMDTSRAKITIAAKWPR